MPEGITELQANIGTVRALSPRDKGILIELQISRSRIQSLASHRQINKIFESFYNVAGRVPPVDNIGYHERDIKFPDNFGGLLNAHALFHGLKRPINEEPDGATTYIYVVSPRFAYEYHPHMVCRARRVEAPKNAVFVVYAKFDAELQHGEIISWEWVFCDADDPTLPKDFNGRYNERVW